jgi:uncharacterized membrane protein
MGLIRFIQAHNRNKELRKTRELEEQKLAVMENKELNEVRDSVQLENREMNKLGNDDAVNMLNIRYAIGEITEGEYEQMKKDLED